MQKAPQISLSSAQLCNVMKANGELSGLELFLLVFLLLPDLGSQCFCCQETVRHKHQNVDSKGAAVGLDHVLGGPYPIPAHHAPSGFQRSHVGNIPVGQSSTILKSNPVNAASHGAASHGNVLPLCSRSAAGVQEHPSVGEQLLAQHGGSWGSAQSKHAQAL